MSIAHFSFSEKTIVPVGGGVWRMSDEKGGNLVGLVTSKEESFSVTSAGGNYVSTVDSNVSLFIPN